MTVLSLLILALLAGSSAEKAPPPLVKQVTVGRLAVIAVRPPMPAVRTDPESDHAYVEMRYHLAHSVHIALACLEERGVETLVVEADVLELESEGRKWRLDASERVRGVGVYFVKPDSPPHLVTCKVGASALQIVVPSFGSRYLGFPECVPEEWRDVEVSGSC